MWKDRNNVVADKVGASVTPEVFVFDKEGLLRYQGQIDDNRNPARTPGHGCLLYTSDAAYARSSVDLGGRRIIKKKKKKKKKR